jgi:hypothetical protein
VLKEELGRMFVGVPGFFQAFGEIVGLEAAEQVVFERCKAGERKQRAFERLSSLVVG